MIDEWMDVDVVGDVVGDVDVDVDDVDVDVDIVYLMLVDAGYLYPVHRSS